MLHLELTILIFYTSVKILQFYHLASSWDAIASVWIFTKPVCRRCFCFTSSLKFWIPCITTVLSVQMLVQHFSGGYSCFTCWSVWDMMRHLWNMNPLITGEQPGAKPCMSAQLHSWRRGEGMQVFWSRLSVTDSFLLINPAFGISQQFCVPGTLFWACLQWARAVFFVRTWLQWCSTAFLCSCFQITCSLLNYAMYW